MYYSEKHVKIWKGEAWGGGDVPKASSLFFEASNARRRVVRTDYNLERWGNVNNEK